MRLKLTLKLANSNLISANYNYSLSSAIYKLLNFGSPEFAEFLHDTGFGLNGKKYKLFSFALRLGKIKIFNDVFKVEQNKVQLFVTSPKLEKFVKSFVIGTLRAQSMEIKANNTLTEFSIEQAELVPEPNFYGKMRFLLLSPLVLTTLKERNGIMRQYYYRYNDDIKELEEKFNNNLVNKYKLIYGKEYNGNGIKFYWDEDYIKRKERNGKRIGKRVLITRDINNPISVIAMEAPFFLEGDTSLMKVGYEAGFGEKNSMGFGMAAVAN